MCGNNNCGICNWFSGNNWWWIIILLLLVCNCGGGCGNNWTPYNNGCNDNNCEDACAFHAIHVEG